jgi:hypothetical protein
MFITVEGFGSIWSKRVRSDSNGAHARTAYYNTTGIEADGRLRHRSRFFGQLRFNQVGGFNPHLIERNVGRVFHGTGTITHDRAALLLHHMSDRPVSPDYFLFTVTGKRTGVLPIDDDWRSDNVLLLSLSQLKGAQEAMLLMPPHSWIRGELGRFVAEPVANTSWRGFLRLIG